MNRLGRAIMEIVGAWKVWSARMVCRELDDGASEAGIAAKLDEMTEQGALARREQGDGTTIYYHTGSHDGDGQGESGP